MKDLELTKEEQALIDQWLPFYRSLADGTREPQNRIQKHFAAVFQGKASDPERTTHEIAYAKYLRQAAQDQERRRIDFEEEREQRPKGEFGNREDHKKIRRQQTTWGH